jgi:hypothetical protein
MIRFLRCLALLTIYGALLSGARAQTTTVISANLAVSHVGEYATVEGEVANFDTRYKASFEVAYFSLTCPQGIRRHRM